LMATGSPPDIYPLVGKNITPHFQGASVLIPVIGKIVDGRASFRHKTVDIQPPPVNNSVAGANRKIARGMGMDARFTADEIFADARIRRTDLAKARIFLATFKRGRDDTHTRRSLTQDLALRPATVSAMVGELIADGLIAETDRTATTGKGRPESSLQLQANRLVTAAIEVTSRTIRGVLVNLEGRIVAKPAWRSRKTRPNRRT